MKDILDQIEKGLQAELYYLSLATALAVPDIASALEHQDERAKPARYMAWFDKHVGPRYCVPVRRSLLMAPELQDHPLFQPKQNLNGMDCYFFRCRLLHQGTAELDQAQRTHDRIWFYEPRDNFQMHNNVQSGPGGVTTLTIDVRIFCRDIISCTEKWTTSVQGMEPFETNAKKLIRRYPAGIPGVPSLVSGPKGLIPPMIG